MVGPDVISPLLNFSCSFYKIKIRTSLYIIRSTMQCILFVCITNYYLLIYSCMYLSSLTRALSVQN